jgi:hypothetical protein
MIETIMIGIAGIGIILLGIEILKIKKEIRNLK